MECVCVCAGEKKRERDNESTCYIEGSGQSGGDCIAW